MVRSSGIFWPPSMEKSIGSRRSCSSASTRPRSQAFAFARCADAYAPDYLHSYFFYEGTLFALVASMLLDIPRGVSCYADHMLDDYALKVVGLHLRQTSLVIATSQRTGMPVSTEVIAVAMEMPAEGPSLGVAPSGR